MTDMRMDAYYYGFDETGVIEIDTILSAVACAGKAFHHTECWTDDDLSFTPAHLKGASCAEWIQNAANEAAESFKKLKESCDATKDKTGA